MKATRNTAVKTLAGVALCAVFATSAAAEGLTSESVAKKLELLHQKEVLLNRIVKSVCFIDAGIEVERNKEAVYQARDEFERSLAEIKAEIAALDQSLSAVRSLSKNFEKKNEQWFKFRVYLDREMKDHSPESSVLGQIALLETGIEKAVERTFKFLEKEAARRGDITLGDMIQENQSFERVIVAEKMVKEACMVAMKQGGAEERAVLAEAIMHFENELTVEEGSALTPPKVKAMVPRWRDMLPRVRLLSEGSEPDENLLQDLDALKHEWFEVSGVILLPRST
ncbi:MAG: hypothetical protein AAF371_14695 [Pseudomonadota bacterium]